jgi:hypothetical protein
VLYGNKNKTKLGIVVQELEEKARQRKLKENGNSKRTYLTLLAGIYCIQSA